MSLSYDYATKRVAVPQVNAQPLLMQDLINSIRTQEASERGIVEDQIADASGKNDLGGSVLTGITVSFRSSWKLEFAAGAYQATVSGGNLSDALARIQNTGSPQVLVQASAAATLVETGQSGLTAQESADLAAAAAGNDPTAIADAVLNRDMAAVPDTNQRSLLNAIRFLRNKWVINGTTLSVKKENDTAEAWQAEVTATPGADPITGNDPS